MCKLASQRCSGGHMTQQPYNFTICTFTVQMPYIAHSSVCRDPMSQKQLSYINPPLCGSHCEVKSCLQCMRGISHLITPPLQSIPRIVTSCSSCTAYGHIQLGAMSCHIGCKTFRCLQDAQLDLLCCTLSMSETLTAQSESSHNQALPVCISSTAVMSCCGAKPFVSHRTQLQNSYATLQLAQACARDTSLHVRLRLSQISLVNMTVCSKPGMLGAPWLR